MSGPLLPALRPVRSRLAAVRRRARPVAPAAETAPPESILPYLGLRTAELALRGLSRRGAYRLTAPLAAALTLCWPAHWQGLRANLAVIRPDLDRRGRRRLLRANVANFLKAWIDVLQMPHRPIADWRQWVTVEGLEHLEAARAGGHGVIMVSCHLGAWESAIVSLRQHFPELALLAERVRPIRCFNWLLRTRTRSGCQVIPLDVDATRRGDLAAAQRSGAAAVRDIYRVLRRGGVVVMAIDRDLLGTGVPMPFFGHRVSVPLGAAAIAARTGAALLPVVVLRQPDDSYLARGYPPVWIAPTGPDPVAADRAVRAASGELLRSMEPLLRQHPDQWHVLSPLFGPPMAADRPDQAPRPPAEERAC